MSKYVIPSYQTGGDNPSQYADTSTFDFLAEYAAKANQQPTADETAISDTTDAANTNPQDYSNDFASLQDNYTKIEERLNNMETQLSTFGEYQGNDQFLNFLFGDSDSKMPMSFNNSTKSTSTTAPTGFQSFSTPQEGRAALENQLQLYQTGRTKNPVKPDSTLLQAMSVYAPASDNNNPKHYAQFIANKLGVDVNTPISQIDTKKWADAITQFEGNTRGNNPGNLRHTRQYGGEGVRSYNPNIANKDSQFVNWYNANTPEGTNNIPFSDKLDYDYYSYFRNGEYKNYKGGHFPDTYKRPNHQTFSNESIYSTPERPGGSWDGNTYIPPKYQAGGVAMTLKQKRTGLNDPSFNHMFFPMKGSNTFRGLDNGEPVNLQDENGNEHILYGPKDTATMHGNVHERRYQVGGTNDSIKEWHKSWLTSPKAAEMNKGERDFTQQRLDAVNEVGDYNYVNGKFIDNLSNNNGNMGMYDKSAHSLYINKKLPKYLQNTVKSHEVSHASDRGGQLMSQEDVKLTDSEGRAAINQTRYEATKSGLYNPMIEDFKKEYINAPNNNGLRQLRERYTPEEIVKLMNSVSSNTNAKSNVAKWGGMNSKYKIKC